MELGNKQLVKDVATLTETVNQLGQAVNVITRALGYTEDTEVGDDAGVQGKDTSGKLGTLRDKLLQRMADNPGGGFLVINDGMGGSERIDTYGHRLSQIMDAMKADKPWNNIKTNKPKRNYGF